MTDIQGHYLVVPGEDKRRLRTLFSRMSPIDLRLKSDYRDLLCRLPLFETLTGSGGSRDSRFVSIREVSEAAPSADIIPGSLSRALLDIRSNDSHNLANLLGVHQLTVIEMLRDIVFPDIESAYYNHEEVSDAV